MKCSGFSFVFIIKAKTYETDGKFHFEPNQNHFFLPGDRSCRGRSLTWHMSRDPQTNLHCTQQCNMSSLQTPRLVTWQSWAERAAQFLLLGVTGRENALVIPRNVAVLTYTLSLPYHTNSQLFLNQREHKISLLPTVQPWIPSS